MITIDQIIYASDEQYNKRVQNITGEIIKHYTKFEINDYTNVSNFVRLKEFMYSHSQRQEFFALLNDKKYNIHFEIINFIRAMERMGLDAVGLYEKSPYIEFIKTTGEISTIQTLDFGRMMFTKATDYYSELKEPRFRLRRKANRCHKNAEFLSTRHPNLIAVTSLCKQMFEDGTYYHSYVIDDEIDKVIDPLYNFAMNKEMYENLFDCQEVFRISGGSLKSAATTAKKLEPELNGIDDLMACTLFQQYIWENELPTPNSRLFKSEPKDKKILIKSKWESKK